MSQMPPPVDMLQYATPLPKPRPTSVTVIAIIAIVFGGMGVLGGFCALPQFLGVNFGPNPMAQSRGLLIYSIVNTGVGFVLAIVELFGGIGMLSLKKAARKALVWFAIATIVVSLITLAIYPLVIGPIMEKSMMAAMKTTPGGPPPATATTIMHWASYGGMFGSVLSLIWPILILYFVRRPHVKEAFERGMPARS